jgi:beta-lactam-binding protein with PASTA domain
MNKEDAVNSLKSFKVEFSGEGNKVLYQSPSSGTQIYEGETVKLMLK